jgi:small neutral amino acid transporter SnatA (MarC family)
MGFILLCIGVQLNIAGITELVQGFQHPAA